ncbi:hypothetical protein M8C21_030164 [Ambrosia artemisiifolia]|uniref:Uncharacterized protein n=1 Tax=Ambrosia artemisiifolia TaxID=4212 RepID=A0AAD5D6L0_AMBAR|nr:hypothetical protein M8C21_030164 [Ambrosia artemisiifolia]
MDEVHLELQDVDVVHDTVQRLLYRVKDEHNQTNRCLPSIYMVPNTLRDLSPSSFNPRVVSIGPLHKEDENVQAFEGRKANYLIDLMCRIHCPQEETLKSCAQKVHASMEQIKACYVWKKTYSEVEIAEMMVMDACFILEFINWFSEFDKSHPGNFLLTQTIIYDLVLLENQIPFFILDEIFRCTILKFDPEASLIKLFHRVLTFLNLFRADIKLHNFSINSTPHILGLLHECYKPQNYVTSVYFPSIIHSAVDLYRAGVNFRPNQNQTWMMGMEVDVYRLIPCLFGSWSKASLRIPILSVHEFTELVFRNLIAYEQTGQTRSYVTSYVIAMNMLVNTQEDVATLVDSKVLVNSIGSNEEAANMINNMGNEVACLEFFYGQQWETLNVYCDNYWPKNIAWLRRTYFNSPWNMIALFAGFILFALTAVQTIFTIKSAGNKY